MADKSTLLRAFNTHLVEFLDDIISIIPGNVFRTTFRSISKMSTEKMTLGRAPNPLGEFANTVQQYSRS